MIKLLFTVLFLVTLNSQLVLADVDQLTEDFKLDLEGTYQGQGCEVRVKTADYGEGYYKTFEFVQIGKKIPKQTFHVAEFSEEVLLREDGTAWINLRDEVGSGVMDNHIRLKMELNKDNEIINVKYSSTRIGFIWPPVQHSSFLCSEMVKKQD